VNRSETGGELEQATELDTIPQRARHSKRTQRWRRRLRRQWGGVVCAEGGGLLLICLSSLTLQSSQGVLLPMIAVGLAGLGVVFMIGTASWLLRN
jgi:hypothetical protein